MTTKIILDKRKTGKTTKLIKLSAETGMYILVPSRQMAKFVADFAVELGHDIPHPIYLDEFLQGVSPFVKRKGILIDEGLMILEDLLGIHIHAITISEREDE